jgi:GT2 family glycosyltransferase
VSVPADAHVAVVILTWNGKRDTLACLDSLAECPRDRVSTIVVDNASTDGTVAAVRHRHPSVHIVENPQNLGFAEGNNVGIRHALEVGAECVLVLNNDTLVADGTVPLLVRELSRHPDAAALCPLIYFFEPADLIWYGGAIFDPSKGRSGRVMHYRERSVGDPETHSTDRATGAAMLVPSNVFREAGLFDSSLFLQFEDVEWSLRARAAGYNIYVAPCAELWHKVSVASGGEHSPLISYYGTRNHLEVCRRFAPLGFALALRRALVIVGVHLRLSTKADRRLASAAAVLAGWRDYRRKKFGKRGV